MTLEEAVKEDVNKSLNDWAKYIYLLGYEAAKKEIIHCKDCIHGSGDIFKTGIVCAKILSATNCDVIDAVVPKDHYCGWGREEE